jgi:FKBP-type peptidyl-prolyl cis-trans isomerase 2
MPMPRGSNLFIDLIALGPDGEEVGGDGAMEITLGQGELPPALEEALANASIGDVVEVEFPAGEVFGDYDPEALQSVPRSEFDDSVELVVGAEIGVNVEHDDGEVEDLDARVVEVSDEAVVLDFNHPLAGKAVTLQATILDPSEVVAEDE